MNRIFLILVVLMTTYVLKAAELKTDIVVDSAQIKASDLFNGLPVEVADKAVLSAPTPGQSATLNAKVLYQIAEDLQIDWRPMDMAVTAIVARESDSIEHEEIFTLLHDAVSKEMAGEHFKIESDQKNLSVHFPKGQLGEVEIKSLEVTRNRNRFIAILTKTMPNSGPISIRITGKVIPMAVVPALIREIKYGELIQPNDVTHIEVESRHANSSLILSENDLLGTTPKLGSIRPNLPIRKAEVEIPRVISKGEEVVISAQNEIMRVTTKGQALEHGTYNSAIKVLNIDSKKVIYATVTGPKHVKVNIPEMATVNVG